MVTLTQSTPVPPQPQPDPLPEPQPTPGPGEPIPVPNQHAPDLRSMLTIQTVAARLGVRVGTVHDRIRTGSMQAQIIHGRRFLTREEVERWQVIGRLPPARRYTPTQSSGCCGCCGRGTGQIPPVRQE